MWPDPKSKMGVWITREVKFIGMGKHAVITVGTSVEHEHAIAHLQRGVALAHLGRKVEARRSVEASITADPESRRRAEAAIQRFGL